MTIDVRDLSGSLDVVSFWKVNSTLSLHDFAIKHIGKKRHCRTSTMDFMMFLIIDDPIMFLSCCYFLKIGGTHGIQAAAALIFNPQADQSPGIHPVLPGWHRVARTGDKSQVN